MTNTRTIDDLVKILGFTPSDEQLAAITAPLEPGMIIAGAGTGKTTVMSARIAWLIMTEQVAPEKILGLTFTKKASHELLTRVRDLLPKAMAFVGDAQVRVDAGEPTISTYNSFGARLLKEHGLRLGYEPDARVVVDATRYQLAMRVVRNTSVDLGGLGFNPVDAVTLMMKLDEQCSNYLVEPNRVIASDQSRIAHLSGLEKTQALTFDMIEASKKRIALALLVDEFRAAKKTNAIIDYSDQIRLAALAASSSSQMCDLLKEQFQVVLLDEYQDTSLSQKVLLQKLFGDGHTVMAVGDPCQAIYGWRGAEISNMENFASDFPRVDDGVATKSASYKLSVNRRSGQNILSAANNMSDSLRAIHQSIIELIVGDQDQVPGEVHVGQFATFKDEVEWIADQIAQIQTKDSWNEVAILLREKKNTGYYVEALERRGIPVQVVSPDALINLPEVREVVSYLQAIAEPTANGALARILMGPRLRIGIRDMAALGKYARGLVYKKDDDAGIDVILDRVIADVEKSERVSLLDALELVGEVRAIDVSDEARARMSALANELRTLRRFAGESAIDVINRIIKVTGIGVETMSREHGAGGTHFDRLASLIDLAGEFRSLDGDASLPAFLAYIRDSERFERIPDSETTLSQNAVVVMTIHQSKGLEFPYVAIPEMTSGVFPGSPKGGQWPKRPEFLPQDILPKVLDERLQAFPAASGPTATDLNKYIAVVKELHEIDERRLAYVAITRAKHQVIASSSWWGSTQIKPRGASEFLLALREHATHVSHWQDQPEDNAVNPLLGTKEFVSWPVAPDSDELALLQEQAKLVMDSESLAEEDVFEGLSGKDLIKANEWQADVDALLEQAQIAITDERVVRLPNSISASQAMAFVRDQDSFLRSLVRPMPRKPSAAADRGTTFHAWVEDYFGQRPLIDDDQLPGAMDSQIYDDAQLEALKKSFQEGVFADRVPFAMEKQFALLVGAHTLLGRADAVFLGSLTDPNKANHWTVVDWKTGAPGSADPLQLSIYRLAVAEILQVDPEQMDAAFYYVTSQKIEQPDRFLSLAELADLL